MMTGVQMETYIADYGITAVRALVKEAMTNGWRSLYAHLSAFVAHEGEEVSRGQVIARVGATGQVTGPHLHFELTRDGVYLNPEYYING